MESYREYPIRCKTCNEQIACFSYLYEDLLSTGRSVEEALNDLGIMACCSRIAMLNPTIVSFNMENREVIEGFRTAQSTDEPDPYAESTSRPVFAACMNITPALAPRLLQPLLQPAQFAAPPNPLTAVQRTLQTRAQPITPAQPGATPTITVMQPQPRLTALQPRVPAIGVVTPIQPRPFGVPVVTPAQTVPAPVHVEPVIPGIELGIDLEGLGDTLGVGIPVERETVEQFQEPILVGVPTINPDPTKVQPLINVGAGKQTRILVGRTYLAQ